MVAGVLFIGALLSALGAAPAQADTVYCDPVTNYCYTVIDSPPSDPPSNPDPTTGFTPGAPSCGYISPTDGKSIRVPCSTGNNYWSNDRQCYISIAADQPTAPPGSSATGAWYQCQQISDPRCANIPSSQWGTPTDLYGCFQGPFGTPFWSNTPPPGIRTLTPAQAAFQLIKSFQLRGIDVGFAPDPNAPNAKSYVGVPIWMWVTNPKPLTYGPYTQTATLGGVTITATAKVTSILWNMGDGTTVPCGNAGTPFKVAYGAVSSPTCGHRYTQPSTSQPGGRYTITATSQWTVTWSGGGQNGTIPLTATSTTSARIQNLEAVNVLPNS